jgi:cytoskeletal protein CcmA (bactofilin family)
MWGKEKKTRASKDTLDTLIGEQTELRGDTHFTGHLHVDGRIRGNVTADPEGGSLLTLSENGSIEGEVKVPNIILNGQVVGDVHAAESIELASKARVQGNVYYRMIEMAMGAAVNGNLVHMSEDQLQEPIVALRGDADEDEPLPTIKLEH